MANDLPTTNRPTSALPSVHAWLATFAAAVRDRDYDAGRALFADDALGCGTRSPWMVGLDRLVDEQWKPIWSVTRGFRFDDDTIHGDIRGETAWVAASWRSEGRRSSGDWFERCGRATFVLTWDGSAWRAVHSHFSLRPEAAAQPAGAEGPGAPA